MVGIIRLCGPRADAYQLKARVDAYAEGAPSVGVFLR